MVGDVSVDDELKRALAVGDGTLIERLVDGLEQRCEIVGAGSVAEEVLRERERDLLLLGSGLGSGATGSGLRAARCAARGSRPARSGRVAIGVPARLRFGSIGFGLTRRRPALARLT